MDRRFISRIRRRLDHLHRKLSVLQRDADDIFQDLGLIGIGVDDLNDACREAATEALLALRNIEAVLEEEGYE